MLLKWQKIVSGLNISKRKFIVRKSTLILPLIHEAVSMGNREKNQSLIANQSLEYIVKLIAGKPNHEIIRERPQWLKDGKKAPELPPESSKDGSDLNMFLTSLRISYH